MSPIWASLTLYDGRPSISPEGTIHKLRWQLAEKRGGAVSMYLYFLKVFRRVMRYQSNSEILIFLIKLFLGFFN
jgi:hypothetical protein